MGQYVLEFYLPILSYVLLLRTDVCVSVLLLRTYVCVSNSIHDCCSCLSSYLRWDSNLCIPAEVSVKNKIIAGEHSIAIKYIADTFTHMECLHCLNAHVVICTVFAKEFHYMMCNLNQEEMDTPVQKYFEKCVPLPINREHTVTQ